MSAGPASPIRIPLGQRWRDARHRLLPVVVFAAALGALSSLWKDHVAAPTLVGQAEPILANVSSHKPGVLAELAVGRFQRVKAGDVVGQLMVADPRILESSLSVIRAEIEMLRVNMSPIAAQQRNAMDYNRVRLDWMRQRAQLASLRVSLQLAETEFHRTEELFKQKISSQQQLDASRATYEGRQREVEELVRLVAEGEQNFKTLQLTNATEITRVSEDPLRAAIAVQESKLRLTEAELSPIALRAPMDGVVSAIFHRSGEAVTAGQPIVSIATLGAVRIVGYLRLPLSEEPRVGERVEVRTRGLHRETGSAQILEVGSQLESLPATLLGPLKVATAELGLPIGISLPANLRIRPGELVDVTLLARTD
jgi:multidrug resistance efflux pump